MAYVAEFSGETNVALTEPPHSGSGGGFLAALQAMGASVSPLLCSRRSAASSQRRPYAAFLSCELETWIEAFGQPQAVSQHYDLLTHVPFQAWQQPFDGRMATCVGHLFERHPGRRWVTLARVLI